MNLRLKVGEKPWKGRVYGHELQAGYLQISFNTTTEKGGVPKPFG